MMSTTSLGSVALAFVALVLAGCAAPAPFPLPTPGLAPPPVAAPALASPHLPGPGRALPSLPAGLDDDLPGEECREVNGTRSEDAAGDEVVHWAGCIKANLPLFDDPSLGTGPDADLWVPWHTAGMVVIVHLRGSEPLDVTLTLPDEGAWHGRDAGSANGDSVVRFEQRAPLHGAWHIHGDVDGITALRGWTITAVLQPG